jgi:hypothetical protein
MFLPNTTSLPATTTATATIEDGARYDARPVPITACNDPHFKGECRTFQVPQAECYKLPPELDNKISSWKEPGFVRCQIYDDGECKKNLRLGRDVDMADLSGSAGDDVIGSVWCVRECRGEC